VGRLGVLVPTPLQAVAQGKPLSDPVERVPGMRLPVNRRVCFTFAGNRHRLERRLRKALPYGILFASQLRASVESAGHGYGNGHRTWYRVPSLSAATGDPSQGSATSDSSVNNKDWVGYPQGFTYAPVAARATPKLPCSPPNSLRGERAFVHRLRNVRGPDRTVYCLPPSKRRRPRADLAETGRLGPGRETTGSVPLPRRRRKAVLRPGLPKMANDMRCLRCGARPEGDANDVRPTRRPPAPRTAVVPTIP
jgi:hypothetical protein